MPIVTLTNVSKTYPSRNGDESEIVAVDDVTLSIEKGDVFGIIGYSGAGKSTLVRLINALEPATSGTITVDGVDITALKESELRRVRGGIGMIFQQFNLFSSRSVKANIAYPLKLAGWSKPDIEERVAELLSFVGLSDKAPRSCWPTRRRARSIRRRRTRCSICSSGSTGSRASRSSSSRTRWMSSRRSRPRSP